MRIDGSHLSIALAGVAVLACAGAAVALALPESGFSRASGLAQASEVRAHALAVPVDATAGDLAQAAAETRASLRQAPANPTAWLRLAYIDSRDPAGLGETGNVALARSYAVAPFGPDDTPWRLAFAFNHWADVDRSTRLLVLNELRWAVSTGVVESETLRSSVTDPAGQIALLLSLDVVAVN